ncbi:GNAT family N-acetyltransferase [uncultured Clostridium sp.]|uniref:GNAT family N-acetyltransferase n=1 Tax=uncultured Clostridium sp. TaxID=59620 RepID=UPI0028E1E398|nr:GNAT family N-acetyltransferase [uncultured Clostridium sp.]
MYTKNEILEIAKSQLALDYSCQLSAFDKEKNTIVEKKFINGRRIYDNDKCFLKILCFGGRTIISTSSIIIPWCEEKLQIYDSAWFFQYPNLRLIDNKLQELGHEIADIHQYYLPEPNISFVEPIANVKWYEYGDIFKFKNDRRFREALAFDKNNPDMLAVAAFDGDKIMGIAGASADSKTMWQIGIDVLPEYRSNGIGKNLVTLLKNEILKRGKIPFYGTGESHFHSQNIAISSGFFPIWAELYSKIKEC